MYPFSGPHPKTESVDLTPLTMGWELMVSSMLELRVVSMSLI